MPKKALLLIPLIIISIIFILYFTRGKILGLSTFNNPPSNINIVLIGDSMTEFLGADTEQFKKYLKEYYPKSELNIMNYGFGSTNILSVPDRLTKPTKHLEVNYPPILDQKPNLILIESFGNNPLAQFPLEEGLKINNETLDKILQIIKERDPNIKIVFVATVSPLRTRYGENVVTLLPEKRLEWADLRIAYIKNHIKYAKDHHIPNINIYEKSLTENGDGNIDYINTNDFIHPSVTGIDFISHEMAKGISLK